MKGKIVLLVLFLPLLYLFAGEKVLMDQVVNRVEKNAIYIYDYCTGEYMKIELNQEEEIECRDVQQVKLEDLKGEPKVASNEECNEDNVQVINITDKNQVFEIYDRSRGKHMLVEIGDDGILRCKDIKIIKKIKK